MQTVPHQSELSTLRQSNQGVRWMVNFVWFLTKAAALELFTSISFEHFIGAFIVFCSLQQLAQNSGLKTGLISSEPTVYFVKCSKSQWGITNNTRWCKKLNGDTFPMIALNTLSILHQKNGRRQKSHIRGILYTALPYWSLAEHPTTLRLIRKDIRPYPLTVHREFRS